MDTVAWATLVFFVATAGILSVFVGYPTLLWLRTLGRRSTERTDEPIDDATLPSVTMVVVVRNGEHFIGPKIENALSLDYPAERLDLVVFSDGSTDGTAAIARSFAASEPRVLALSTEEHHGKARALNAAASHGAGEVLVFSDADALLDRNALRRLVHPFEEPTIGGVCGARGIGSDRAKMDTAQRRYISLDSLVKRLESRRGSITSNDGKLYAIRRGLFSEVAEGVTDDLYCALKVVDHGFRFVFEPSAAVSIHSPSRTAAHEVSRRRRIVARSLRGMWLMRRVFNPARSGFFSVGLFVNKVLRRLLPVFMVLALASAAVLAIHSVVFAVLVAVALGLLLLAAVGSLATAERLPRPLSGVVSLAQYFVLGNWGTLLGVADFLRNRTVVRWDPIKGEESPGR